MSDFSALCVKAVEGMYRGDHLPTLVLCDFLDERGDDRGRRLRFRHRQCVEQIARCDAELEAGKKTFRDAPECLRMHRDCYGDIRHKRVADFLSYVFRILSTNPGERALRRRLKNFGIGIVAPKGW